VRSERVWEEQVERVDGVDVNWRNGVPFCDEDSCKHYAGKRCRLLGFRPGTICEPAVIEMAKLLNRGAR
jgi:hypothetical protein